MKLIGEQIEISVFRRELHRQRSSIVILWQCQQSAVSQCACAVARVAGSKTLPRFTPCCGVIDYLHAYLAGRRRGLLLLLLLIPRTLIFNASSAPPITASN